MLERRSLFFSLVFLSLAPVGCENDTAQSFRYGPSTGGASGGNGFGGNNAGGQKHAGAGGASNNQGGFKQGGAGLQPSGGMGGVGQAGSSGTDAGGTGNAAGHCQDKTPATFSATP